MATKAKANNAPRTITGRVVAIRYSHHSNSGNASYWVAILDSQGYGEIYQTAANSSLGYAIHNPEFRDNAHTFERNARGQITRALRSVEE